jgi:hypothetical protein
MNSNTIKLEDKKLEIDAEENILLLKIAYIESNIELNNKRIIENIEEHNKFIDFCESVKVYELYKFGLIKLTYIEINKKINHDKKVYKQIIKIYTNIINYMTKDKTILIDNIIKKLQVENENILYNYFSLQKKHKYLINKCKYMIKNNNITKVYKSNPQIELIITKLYENYNKIKENNIKVKKLKTIKASILYKLQEHNI